ncbi:MAG: histidine kinase dimerization/phosphoacceptor domain -containing protein [Thermodesulfobacteriota bacterium]|nr:histidine kinase dimerization/phosphoacceptor domain -containing protein [Thermodesulfobacteriota bacterium]
MKILSIRTPIALIVTGLALVVYVSFLVVSNYLSQADLQKTVFERLQNEVEKRATAVSYFYTERKNDLKNLAASRALEIFFENKALGMTMEYGLRASLIGVSDRLSRLLEERRIGWDRIYVRAVFVDDSGELLVDTSKNGHKYSWKRFLAPEGGNALIISEHDGKLPMTMVSIPYFFKGKYSGQIIAWVLSQVVYSHLIKIKSVSSKHVVYVDCGNGHLYLPAHMQSRTALPDLSNVEIGKPRRFKSAGMEMLALRVPVEETPFHIISILPVSEVFGHTSPWRLLLIMGALSVVILGSAVFVLRVNNRSLALRVRVEEASRREREVAEKNILLKQQVARRKQAENQIKASLEEKEVLLKEVHHRVKNNLQVISSLFNLQLGYIRDKYDIEMFKESQNRVRSMALIHEKLYQSEDLARIDFHEYTRKLTTSLFHLYAVYPETITLEVKADDVFLGIDNAVPCGLIINELVSNCLKYAFPGGKKGKIRVELRSDKNLHAGNKFTLMVSDNGAGFPKDLDFRNTETLGLQLVMTLVKQIKGTIELDRDGGTKFKIAFVSREKKDNEGIEDRG